jgi:hypothetical protein
MGNVALCFVLLVCEFVLSCPCFQQLWDHGQHLYGRCDVIHSLFIVQLSDTCLIGVNTCDRTVAATEMSPLRINSKLKRSTSPAHLISASQMPIRY